MKIEHMITVFLFVCCCALSFAASEEDNIKNKSALSLSASPSGVLFLPPSTPPIAISMVSPHREPFIEGVADMLAAKYASEKKMPKSKALVIIERTLPKNELPINFVKESVAVKEEVEDQSCSALPFESDPNEHETFFCMDDEE